jgi:hypothetical protein
VECINHCKKGELININLKIYFFYYITQLNFSNNQKLDKKMYGGLTGFGAYPSLGGLLIGGAKTPRKQDDPQAYAQYRGVKNFYLNQKRMQAKDNLKHLIDAERWASTVADSGGHPEYADWLTRDYVKDIKLLQRKTLPSWAATEYVYGEKFGRPTPPRAKMTEEQKMMMREDKLAKELRRQELGVPKIYNPRTKRMVYVDTPTGKKLVKAQSGLSAFQSKFRSRGPTTTTERLYSNIDEYGANRSGLSLGPQARSIAAASRSGRNPLGISDAQLIAALESGSM